MAALAAALAALSRFAAGAGRRLLSVDVNPLLVLPEGQGAFAADAVIELEEARLMAINYDQLLNYPIPEIRQTLRWQDAALYNFSIGLGQDPMDQKQLDFLYEPRLRAMPSMAVVLGYPGFWLRNPDTGVDWRRCCMASSRSSCTSRCRRKARSSAARASPASSIAARARARCCTTSAWSSMRATGEKLATLDQHHLRCAAMAASAARRAR